MTQAFAFLSYARADLERLDRQGVKHYASRLTEAGVPIGIDYETIGGAFDWSREIEASIDRSKCLIFFVSSASFASPHCEKEIVHAFQSGKPCLAFFLQPLRQLGSYFPAPIAQALSRSQHLDLWAYQNDAWIFPAARLLRECGIPGLDKLANDPRARQLPDPYDGLGAWHLGHIMTWAKAAIVETLTKTRKRLDWGGEQPDVNLGIGLCHLALKSDLAEARNRLARARSALTDVPQVSLYAALSICAYTPIGSLHRRDHQMAHDWCSHALTIFPDYRAALFLLAAMQRDYALANRVRERGERSSDQLLLDAGQAPPDRLEMAALARILDLRDRTLTAALSGLV